MKIVIIGSNGQLGSDLCKVIGDKTCDVIGLTHSMCDITQAKETAILMEELSPDVIINTAAFHNVKLCETERHNAIWINAIAPSNLGRICDKLGALFINISTDYVFDGTKGEAYIETDRTNPLQMYGSSKAFGESCVAYDTEKYYIVRTSSLFGKAGCSGKGGNFVENTIKRLSSGDQMTVVSDIVMSPTNTKDLAKAISFLVFDRPSFGIYHISNKGGCSWYEFAKTIGNIKGIHTKVLETTTKEQNEQIKRPLYSVLNSDKLFHAGFVMRGWHEALEEYLS